MRLIIKDEENENIKTRNEVKRVLTASLMIALEVQKEKNKLFLEQIEKIQI